MTSHNSSSHLRACKIWSLTLATSDCLYFTIVHVVKNKKNNNDALHWRIYANTTMNILNQTRDTKRFANVVEKRSMGYNKNLRRLQKHESETNLFSVLSMIKLQNMSGGKAKFRRRLTGSSRMSLVSNNSQESEHVSTQFS